jgi:hypothetical protein
LEWPRTRGRACWVEKGEGEECLGMAKDKGKSVLGWRRRRGEACWVEKGEYTNRTLLTLTFSTPHPSHYHSLKRKSLSSLTFITIFFFTK